MTHGGVTVEGQRQPWMIPLTGASAKELELALRFIGHECDRETPDVRLIQKVIDHALASTKHKLCCACGGTGVQA